MSSADEESTEEGAAAPAVQGAGAGYGADPRHSDGAGSPHYAGGGLAVWGDGLIARRAPERARQHVRAVSGEGAKEARSEGFRGTEEGKRTGDRSEPSAVPEQLTGHPGAGDDASAPGGSYGTATTGSRYRGAPGEPDTGPEDDVLRQRLGALRELVGLSRTRLAETELAEAGRVLEEASARGRLPRAYTSVALAGATGSGKSSLFNALAGARLSDTGMRRPTTAAPVACTWETAGEPEGGADGLLDRLGIAPSARRRLRVPAPAYRAGAHPPGQRDGQPGPVPPGAGLNGLVLIDLPDHDSVAEGHREHVDRLLQLVDAVIWVADPEKYADAVLHERYLRPLAGYAEVTFVVLNQTDRLPGEATDTVLDDLRRLLDEDGMALGEHGEPGARVLAVSALTGDGVADLREELGTFVASRRAAALRLIADLDGAVRRLRPVYAEPGRGATAVTPVGLTEHTRETFEDRLASAVGAEAAGQSAERAWLRQAEQACGTIWSGFARRRAVRRMSQTDCAGETLLGLRAEGSETGTASGTDTGGPGNGAAEGRADACVARPVLDLAVRELSDQASNGLPDAWGRIVRDAARRGAEELTEALGEAVRQETAADLTAVQEDGRVRGRGPRRGRGQGTGGGAARGARVPGEDAGLPRPTWWGATAVVQSVLFGLQVVGVLWTLAELFGVGGGVGWVPGALACCGAAGAPLLAWACRTAARGPARAYGLEKERRLRSLAAGCGRSRVLEPVAAELLRYREVREQYVIAAGGVDQA